MDVRRVAGIKSMLFGGEGVFLATLTGPGKVWLQSLPFSRWPAACGWPHRRAAARAAAKARCWAAWAGCWMVTTGSDPLIW